ncbi:hypothetical protein RvY_02585 [Ramazzottius varieornatus]|uniref:Uncharacterized protein n=1 Tax=Ramazzottius varieornatus TaxID=947166 RepID=A0A1D1UL01_RAMVA|nr:hypothetical protein RvY_02585 [Ramazzottius varieornatus]
MAFTQNREGFWAFCRRTAVVRRVPQIANVPPIEERFIAHSRVSNFAVSLLVQFDMTKISSLQQLERNVGHVDV